MIRTETARFQIQRLIRKVPFHPFALNMENGDRVIIEHRENIAFDPRENGREEFDVITSKMHYYSHFSAVSSAAELDRGDLPE